MSYLKFDKNLLINLDQSLPKEILRTNMAGSYHCTTVIGCNTRKQHGLLVTPIKEMSVFHYPLQVLLVARKLKYPDKDLNK